eukprot:TRINITY_DN8215_c1_g3_i1.p1 TRINITY_DN8215_c1_g3~~TRINITY_DN8215_c1_g3_i1.p1  ORF type:complete len:920 (+),score=79.93 TRINITY_DN8215_c1_g3_i1:78-2762(+)
MTDLVSGVSCFACLAVGVTTGVWAVAVSVGFCFAYMEEGELFRTDPDLDEEQRSSTWMMGITGQSTWRVIGLLSLLSVPGSAFLTSGLMWGNAKSSASSTWSNTDSTLECLLGAVLASFLAMFTTTTILRLRRSKYLRLCMAWVVFYYFLCCFIVIINTTNWNEKWQEQRILVITLLTMVFHMVLEACFALYRSMLGNKATTDEPPAVTEQGHPLLKNEVDPHEANGSTTITLVKKPEEAYGLMIEDMKVISAGNDSPARDYTNRDITHVNGGEVSTFSDIQRNLSASSEKVALTFAPKDTEARTVFEPEETSVRRGIKPVVICKGFPYQQDGTRGEMAGFGEFSNENKIAVQFPHAWKTFFIPPENLEIVAHSDFNDVRTSQLAPFSLLGLTGRIHSFNESLVTVDFGPTHGFHDLLPVHLVMLDDFEPSHVLNHFRYLEPHKGGSFNLPILDKESVPLRGRYNKPIDSVLDKFRIEDMGDGAYTVTDPRNEVIRSFKLSRGEGVTNEESPAPSEKNNSVEVKPNNKTQFKSLLSQFYLFTNPGGLQAVDDLVERCYGTRDGPRELLARLYVKYPMQVTRGDLKWLEAMVMENMSTDVSSYAVHGFLEKGLTYRKRFVKVTAVEENLPVYATTDGEFTLMSSNMHWVVATRHGEVLLHSSGPHQHAANPSSIWLWNTRDGPEPSVSVHPAINTIHTTPSRHRSFVPTSINNVEYVVPGNVPPVYHPHKTVSFGLVGKNINTAVQYSISGTSVRFSTKKRIMLAMDGTGFYVYFAEQGLDSKVYLPRNPEGVLGSLKRLCEEASVVEDLYNQYRSIAPDGGLSEVQSGRSSSSSSDKDKKDEGVLPLPGIESSLVAPLNKELPDGLLPSSRKSSDAQKSAGKEVPAPASTTPSV